MPVCLSVCLSVSVLYLIATEWLEVDILACTQIPML